MSSDDNNIRNDDNHSANEMVDCPACGLPAEITDRFTLGGAPEPVDHVKIVCVMRHWFTLPVDLLPARPDGDCLKPESTRPQTRSGT